MICSSAGISDSAPSRPKRLVPLYLTSMNCSKPSASTSFCRIAFLPSAVKVISLSAPSMRAWIQPFSSGIRHVHELDAERRAVGAGQDLQHLPDGAELQPEHVVEEDRPVVVGFREAVILRGKFVIVLERLGDAERVEIGVQMAAHAEGADHHDGADRIAGRLMHIGVGERGAVDDGLVPDLLLDRLFDQAPVAVERRDQFAIGLQRPGRLRPGCALGVLPDVVGIVLQRGEEIAPFRGHRFRIVLPGGMQLLDVIGIAAIEERGEGKLVVGLILSCHVHCRSFCSVSLFQRQ